MDLLFKIYVMMEMQLMEMDVLLHAKFNRAGVAQTVLLAL
jgi:hypothetical protein